MLMVRHGMSVWESVMRYATKTLFCRTSNGVLILIVLLVLPATQRKTVVTSDCGYKFDIPLEQVNQVHSRPPKPPTEEKPGPTAVESRWPDVAKLAPDEMPITSA